MRIEPTRSLTQTLRRHADATSGAAALDPPVVRPKSHGFCLRRRPRCPPCSPGANSTLSLNDDNGPAPRSRATLTHPTRTSLQETRSNSGADPPSQSFLYRQSHAGQRPRLLAPRHSLPSRAAPHVRRERDDGVQMLVDDLDPRSDPATSTGELRARESTPPAASPNVVNSPW